MANEYIKLICQLRDSAKLEQATCEADGIETSGYVEMLRAAADAIETLSKGINTYSDAAFERAQELGYAKERIRELDEACAIYCNERDELKLQIDEMRAAEVEACEDRATPDPVIMYTCDRRACDRCNEECHLTADIRHAEHFEVMHFGGFREKEA